MRQVRTGRNFEHPASYLKSFYLVARFCCFADSYVYFQALLFYLERQTRFEDLLYTNNLDELG
jgi:uncharacterized membrane protein YcgQ (UPF0703/DUF1980 family)